MSKITPCLWFNGDAEAAATLYISLFPDSAINTVSYYGDGAPFPAGTAMMVAFSLNGQSYQGLNGGPQYPHSEAVSFSVNCEDQRELDYYWEALTANGGTPGQCGWLKDRYGISWQIIPKALSEFLGGRDPAGRSRSMQALMKMSKINIAELHAAYGAAP